MKSAFGTSKFRILIEIQEIDIRETGIRDIEIWEIDIRKIEFGILICNPSTGK